MLTKSTPVVMATTALIIVCSPVLSGKGAGREMRGDGVGVKLEPGNPTRPCPPLLMQLPEGPCALPPAPPGPTPRCPGPLAVTLEPQVWHPIASVPRIKSTACAV